MRETKERNREMETFVKNIKFIMDRDGWNQSSLEKTGCTTRQSIRKIFLGKEQVTIRRGSKIAKALGYGLSELLDPSLQKKVLKIGEKRTSKK